MAEFKIDLSFRYMLIADLDIALSRCQFPVHSTPHLRASASVDSRIGVRRVDKRDRPWVLTSGGHVRMRGTSEDHHDIRGHLITGTDHQDTLDTR